MSQELVLISTANQIDLRMSRDSANDDSNWSAQDNTELFGISDVVNTGGGIARASLGSAMDITDACFEIAKASTSFGIGIGRTFLNHAGLSTMPLDAAEFFALGGIQIGHTATSMSLQGSSEAVRLTQGLFGDPFTMELVKAVIDMTAIEIKKTCTQVGMIEMWKYFSAWVKLQKLTKEQWCKDFIFPNVEEIFVDPALPNAWKLLPSFQESNSTKTTNFPSDPMTLLPFLKRFVKFANGCYGERSLQMFGGEMLPKLKFSSDLHFYADYCGIPVKDVIYVSSLESKSDIFNSEYQPKFVLSLDHSHSTIVLAFRGTASAKDLVVDLAAEVIKLSIGNDPTMYSLHGGMLKVVAKVSDPSHSSGIFQKTKDLLDQYPEYSLTLTGIDNVTIGHSLGAGLASILSLLWADPDTGRTRPESGLGDHEVKVYAFACPSTMDIRLSERTQGMILTTVIGWDWLARVSHASVLEIRDAALKLKETEVEQPGILECIMSGECTPEERAKLFNLRHQITQEHIPRENDYEKIHPPGRIAWIYKSMDNPDKYAFYHVKDRSKVFGEILFDDDMMKSHHPPSYDDILFSM